MKTMATKEINKQDIKILELLNSWEKKEEFYNLFSIHYFVLDEKFEEYRDLNFLLGEKNAQKHRNELLSFGSYETGGSFCLWYYPELETKAPVVYIGDCGELAFVAPSFQDFVCLLSKGKLICAGGNDVNSNSILHQWGDFDDFDEQLDELAEENDISIKKAEKKLNKSLIKFRKFISEEITCRKEKEIFEDVNAHPIFAKWVEEISE